MEKTWGELREQHRPVQQSTRVPMRADLLDRISQLEQQAEREEQLDKRENRAPVAPQIAEQIQQLEQEAAASEVEFTFVAIGRRPYADLLAEHPPTDEQVANANRDDSATPAYNTDTFPPALLTAACTQPEGATLEDMIDVWENWSQGQISNLWGACLAANLGSADVGPKSEIASAILRGSGPS